MLSPGANGLLLIPLIELVERAQVAFAPQLSASIEAIFDYLYAELPHDLREQRAQAIALEGRGHG